MQDIQFALNHMAAPRLGIAAFMELARSLDLKAIEIRNDLAGNAILDGTPATAVRSLASEHGLEIISINALQRFNEWNATRAAEAEALITYARDCGAEGLVLVPVNDGSGRRQGEREDNLRQSLAALAPLLSAAGLTGFVEPLGFATCSLRSKRAAAEAITDSGAAAGIFRLVHDTFHHHLAGEPEIFPQDTGLVHISGVTERALPMGLMRDAHRVLVDNADRIGNVRQIRALLNRGYEGFFSFEPFAESVHALDDPAIALKASIDLIGSQL